ncbi:hypothetical protein KIPB_015856, partial [Kipferlia bialata]
EEGAPRILPIYCPAAVGRVLTRVVGVPSCHIHTLSPSLPVSFTVTQRDRDKPTDRPVYTKVSIQCVMSMRGDLSLSLSLSLHP